MDYPEILETLIRHLKTLPGVGRRSAERMALAILQLPEARVREFGETLSALPEKITYCPECGNLSERQERCSICRQLTRDRSVICVVEDFTRIAGIEKSGAYRGLYHVLGGRLSPLDDAEEDALRIPELAARLADGKVQELILALGGDVEGRATAIYLARKFAAPELKITTLAQGLPAGADLAYADAATIACAMSGRLKL